MCAGNHAFGPAVIASSVTQTLQTLSESRLFGPVFWAKRSERVIKCLIAFHSKHTHTL